MNESGELKIDTNRGKVTLNEIPFSEFPPIPPPRVKRHKSSSRMLILQALSPQFPVNFAAILIGCLYESGHSWSVDGEGIKIQYHPKIVQKYRKHLQALVKNGRVIKSKQRVISHSPKFTLAKTYYSLRKRREV